MASDPALLSSRGLYQDIASREVVDGAIEYEPDYALWSDGADKRRWLVLPEGGWIDTREMSHWRFPVGTKLFKEFSLDGQLIETRLIERIADTGDLKRDVFAGTFVWRPDQSDAVLTQDGVANANGTEHDVPRQKLCLRCHQGEPSGILGVSAVQLSRSGRLRALVDAGLLNAPPERDFPIPGDAVQSAALGTLHANCGHCHSAEGMTPKMHLRFLTEEADAPLEWLELYRTTIGQPIDEEWLDHPPEFTRRVVPGDPDRSAIAYRMAQRGADALVPDQMPPIATTKVDAQGLDAVRAWIAALPARAPDSPAAPPRPTQHADEGRAQRPPVDDSTEADAGMPSQGNASDGALPTGAPTHEPTAQADDDRHADESEGDAAHSGTTEPDSRAAEAVDEHWRDESEAHASDDDRGGDEDDTRASDDDRGGDEDDARASDEHDASDGDDDDPSSESDEGDEDCE